jgi:IS30 family transposase
MINQGDLGIHMILSEGKKRHLSRCERLEIIWLYHNNIELREIAAFYDVHASTIWRTIKKRKTLRKSLEQCLEELTLKKY